MKTKFRMSHLWLFHLHLCCLWEPKEKSRCLHKQTKTQSESLKMKTTKKKNKRRWETSSLLETKLNTTCCLSSFIRYGLFFFLFSLHSIYSQFPWLALTHTNINMPGTHRHMGWSWLITGRGEGGALMQKKKKESEIALNTHKNKLLV